MFSGFRDFEIVFLVRAVGVYEFRGVSLEDSVYAGGFSIIERVWVGFRLVLFLVFAF